jgi:hypothetical protein
LRDQTPEVLTTDYIQITNFFPHKLSHPTGKAAHGCIHTPFQSQEYSRLPSSGLKDSDTEGQRKYPLRRALENSEFLC